MHRNLEPKRETPRFLNEQPEMSIMAPSNQLNMSALPRIRGIKPRTHPHTLIFPDQK